MPSQSSATLSHACINNGDVPAMLIRLTTLGLDPLVSNATLLHQQSVLQRCIIRCANMLAAFIILKALPQSNKCEDEPHIEEASGGAAKRDIHIPDQPLVVRGMPSLPKTLHAHVSDLHVCWGLTTGTIPINRSSSSCFLLAMACRDSYSHPVVMLRALYRVLQRCRHHLARCKKVSPEVCQEQRVCSWLL